MVLTEEVIEIIRAKTGLRIRNRLAFELDKSPRTIERWVEDNNEALTMFDALKIICEETGMKQKEVLTEKEVQD